MAVKLYPDRILCLVTLGLVSFGLVMLYSASAVVALDAHRSSYFFLIKQSIWVGIGLGLMFGLMIFDYRKLRNPLVIYSLVAVTGALLIGVLFTPAINNTHRWIRFGLLSFQPSEFAKLALVVVLSYQLGRRRDQLADFFTGSFFPLAITALFTYLVLIEPDYGTAMSLVLIGSCLFFISGVPLSKLVGMASVSLPVLAYFIYSSPYRMSRIGVYWDPYIDPLGKGYQVIQSMQAIGSGGMLGTGFMQSQQKLFYLPEAHSDFIFAVIGEELGLFGGLAVLMAFSVVLWRGFVIAWRASDKFGFLLAMGLTMCLVGQAMINIGVTLGLLPTTGLPLPFISAGGSSLIASLAAVGLLLSVSQHAR